MNLYLLQINNVQLAFVGNTIPIAFLVRANNCLEAVNTLERRTKYHGLSFDCKDTADEYLIYEIGIEG